MDYYSKQISKLIEELVNFIKLSREHQLEVISRSFHERM